MIKLKIVNSDVVIVGSGVSGLMAAITAKNNGYHVFVVSKEPISWGNTRISGGIVASNEYDKETFAEDVFETGRYINQKYLVDAVIKESPNQNQRLEEWGHIYLRNRNNPNEKELVKPGGHSKARTLKSLHRGISFSNTLRHKLLSMDVNIREEVVACKIVVRHNKVYGLLCYDWVNDEWLGFNTNIVILACGGAGMIYYPHSDNMRSATGDGYALGLMAGAKLIDMEQIQFIPFGVVYPKGMQGLELGDTSAAGPYGKLLNQIGEIVEHQPFNKTREYISRLIAIEVAKGNGSPNGGLWLDPTENRKHEDGELHWQHWKSIGTTETIKNAYGIKASQWKEKFEVCPTQHYCMGGLYVNEFGETNVSGLYAVGENAGGFHGAGRMGSMSLFESLTFGSLVGEKLKVKNSQANLNKYDYFEEIQEFIQLFRGMTEDHPIQIKKEIGQLMWECCGVIRTEEKLLSLVQFLNDIEMKVTSLKVHFQKNNYYFLQLFELYAMILTSKAVALSALERRESRGSHYRSDFPKELSVWQKRNIIVSKRERDLEVQVVNGHE